MNREPRFVRFRNARTEVCRKKRGAVAAAAASAGNRGDDPADRGRAAATSYSVFAVLWFDAVVERRRAWRAHTRSSSFSIGIPTAQQVLAQPAQTVQLFCEAQITTDAKGIITHIHASQDTRGAEMRLSRCAEAFHVK
jgi:hypothetical protein